MKRTGEIPGYGVMAACTLLALWVVLATWGLQEKYGALLESQAELNERFIALVEWTAFRHPPEWFEEEYADKHKPQEAETNALDDEPGSVR